MALSQSALSELLDAIRAGGSADVMRDAMTLVLQQLIELEADQAIRKYQGRRYWLPWALTESSRPSVTARTPARSKASAVATRHRRGGQGQDDSATLHV